MKVQLEIDDQIKEPIITITCCEVTNEVKSIQKLILEKLGNTKDLVFYKDNQEFYFPLEEILFFETANNMVYAHSRTDIYKVKFKLYELEQRLPSMFTRVSKSTILNVKQVYSIDHNFTSYSLIKFNQSHKQVYVSRFYYKNLKSQLERRNYL